MSNRKEWVLQKEHELRCEVKENEWLNVRLLNGSAEIFGVELAPNREYTFHDHNFAIYTWYGCTIETSGADASSLYVADSSPMVAYVNTHIQLEARRDVALANSDSGPRVIIVGGTDQGKSSFSQILTAYAVRLDRTPILVDLDVGQSNVSIPGTIAAIPLDKSCLNVEDGFTNYTPLVYFFGHNSPKDNIDLYKMMVTNLSKPVNRRLDKDIDAKSSGIIVNTTGWIDGAGLDIILHIIKEFSIDVILVMNNDKLFSTLNSSHFDLTNNNNKPIVIKLPSSGGIVQRDATVRKRFRKSKVHEYFYGKPQLNNTLLYSPERKEGLSISAFTFLRVGGIQLTEGMKVMGEKSAHQDACKLIKIVPTSELVYSIVAVLNNVEQDSYHHSSHYQPSKTGEVSQELLESNVAGFISIVQMDFENDRMAILSPCPGALPSYNLLVGSIKWVE